MFSLASFFKKYSNKILHNQAIKAMAQFYQHADTNPAVWVSIAINKNIISDSFLTKELDLLTAADLFNLKLAQKKEGINLQLWKNQNSLCKANIERTDALAIDFNHLIDKLIETEIFTFQQTLNFISIESNKIFPAAKIAEEEKALEWIRVSFLVLEKAIIESLSNPEFLFQLLLFFGINPKTEAREIRVVAFNLDIKFELRPSGILRIKIFNDKEGLTGSQKVAALQGDFDIRKREMFDELTKLMGALSRGIKY